MPLDILKKYLLSSVAFAPRGGADGARGAAPAGDDGGDAGGEDDFAGDDDDDAGEGDEEPGGDTDPEDDAGAVDDDAGDDDDLTARGGRQQQDDRGTSQPRNRRAGRIERLSRERNELQTRLDDMERRLNERTQPAQQQEQQMSPAQEQALLATMTVEERLDYKNDKMLKTMQQNNNMLQRNMQDQTDRTMFETKLAAKPHLRRFEAEVNTRYNKVIQSGSYLPREAILIYVLGERAYGADTSKQRQQSGERVRRQQTRPTSGRNDVQGQQRRGGRSLEARLEDVQI